MITRRGFGRFAPYVAQTATLAVLLFVVLQLWRFTFDVQFNYLGDSLWYAVLAKSIVQNGWAYFVPQLSAPYGLSAAAFPAMTNADWLVMRVLATVIDNPATVFNAFWLTTIFFTAWAALFSLRILGVPAWLAAVGGLLYACLPFTWMRSTSHLSLVFYTVPLLCTFSIYLVRGPVAPCTDATYRRAGILGALVQGFNYVYFSWFAILLFVVAGLLGYVHHRRRDVVAWAAIVIVLISVAALVNLAPSFYSWQKHGKPNIGYKVPAEAEVYGLKIRHLVLPHHENPLRPLRSWATRDRKAAFPNENENGIARLGLFGALGFVFLLAVSLRLLWREGTDGDTLRAMAALNVVALLVTTVGGFGAIINVLTVPDIRAYNRFSVFIAFFSIAGLSVWLAGRWRETRTGLRPVMAGVVLVVAGFSLYDQVLDARIITAAYDRDRAVAAEVDAVVKRMEVIFPERTAVFQFPITDFPADFNRGRMLAYDHSLPYLRSDHFRWSWPSLTPRQIAWSRFIASLQGGDSVRALGAAGFRAVWIDRYGYRDSGRGIAAAVVSAGAVEVLAGTSRRYAVFDIQAVVRELRGGRLGGGALRTPQAQAR
jgi:phosphoglycerol transferase